MKSHSIDWTQQDVLMARSGLGAAEINRAFCLAAKVFVALVPGLAIVTGAALITTLPSLAPVLEAAVWAAGFVFLALAIESRKATVGLLLGTGLVLPSLALASSRIAVEFAILAAALVAVWVAVAIFRR